MFLSKICHHVEVSRFLAPRTVTTVTLFLNHVSPLNIFLFVTIFCFVFVLILISTFVNIHTRTNTLYSVYILYIARYVHYLYLLYGMVYVSYT